MEPIAGLFGAAAVVVCSNSYSQYGSIYFKLARPSHVFSASCGNTDEHEKA